MKATTAGTLGPAGSQATPYCTRTPWPSLLARGNLGQEASNHTALPRRRWCGSEVPGGCTAAPSATCHAPDWGSSASQRSPAHRDHGGPSMEVAPPVQRVLCRPRRPALGGLAWGWGLKPQGSTAGPTPNGTASLESNPPPAPPICASPAGTWPPCRSRRALWNAHCLSPSRTGCGQRGSAPGWTPLRISPIPESGDLEDEIWDL